MNNYAISCCSTVDLTVEMLNKRNIFWVAFPVVLRGEVFFDDMFSSFISANDFYHALKHGEVTTTSQINTQTYIEHFENILKSYSQVIHVSMSSNLSGTYNNALNASKQINKKYNRTAVYVVDSLTTSSGYGMLVQLLCDKRDENATFDEAINYAEKVKLHIRTEFFVTDLSFLVRGGRVSKTSALLGNLLKIYPVLYINNQGKLTLRKKVRGKIKAIDELIKQMKSLTNEDYGNKCFVGNSSCEQDARTLTCEVEKNFPNLKNKIQLYSIGPTTGSHTGPNTLALFYLSNQKREN